MRRVVGCVLGMLVAAAGSGPVVSVAAVSEPERLWKVGTQAFEDGLYDLAYRELGRFVAAAPADRRRGDAHFRRGKAAFALGGYGEALAEFEAAERFPLQTGGEHEAMYWQAETLFRLRRFEEASDRYARFVTLAPNSPYVAEALYARGHSELELGRAEAAVGAFSALVRQQPQSELAASAAYAAARELVRARRWEETIALLSTYQTRYPTSRFLAETRYLLGVAQIEAGRGADGIRTLAEFIGATPNHELVPAARILLAEAYVKAGRAREAVEQYRAFVRQAPAHPSVPQALYQIGELSQRLGRAAEAEVAWKTLRRDHPRERVAGLAGLGMASLYLKRRQFDQAMEAAREVADRETGVRLEALLLLGESAFRAGKTVEADRAYAAAVAEAPAGSAERFRGLAGVGLVAESQREADAARRAYQEIVQGAADDELVRWARGRLQGLEERDRPPPEEKPRRRPRSRGRAGS